MSKAFTIGFSIAIVAIVAIVFAVHNSQKGLVLEPTGRILSVRTASLDDQNSVLAVDFSVTNPSDRNLVIRYITLGIHDAKGNSPETMQIAASDLPALFRYHHELGVLDRTPILERDSIDPHRTATGITAVRLPIPLSDLQARRDVTLEIEDITGPKVDLVSR